MDDLKLSDEGIILPFFLPTKTVRSGSNAWIGYPFLYKVLQSDEGSSEDDGLNGLTSTTKESGVMVIANVSFSDVVRHVVDNPDVTQFISTSAYLNRQISFAHRLVERDRKDVHVVAVDAEHLLGNEIVNLADEKTLRKYLFGDQRALNFAQAWGLVLVANEIPNVAIIQSARFFYDESNGLVDFDVKENPNYAGESGTPPTEADPDYPDSVDHSSYPF